MSGDRDERRRRPPEPMVQTRPLAGPDRKEVEPATRLGRYAIVGRLGAGGMGEVLCAVDEEIGRELAIKVLRHEGDRVLGEKFVLEARVTGQLEHPGIPPVHEIGRTPEGHAYFAMKRIAGEDLEKRLARLAARPEPPAGRTDLAESLPIFVKVCDAMRFAHSRGVIHRDLKPANVMVGEFGEVYVMDWGLAKVLGDDDSSRPPSSIRWDEARPTATLEGAIMGTPAYMSPEQAEGRISELDERSDVYALGAILYEMLALAPAFGGRDPYRIVKQVARGGVVSPSRRSPDRTVPWELEAVVQRAMARDPRDRYPSVAELQADVGRYLEGGTLAAARYSRWQLARKWIAQHRAASLATVAVVAIGLVLAAVAAIGIGRSAARERDARAASTEDRIEAARQEAIADSERRHALQRLSDAHVLAARDALRDHDAGAAAVHLAHARKVLDTPLAYAAGFEALPLLASLERSVEAGGRLRSWDLSPDGRSAILALEDEVRILDLESGVVRTVAGGATSQVRFSRDGARWLAVGPGRDVHVRDLEGRVAYTARPADGWSTQGAAISADGSLLAMALRDRGDEGRLELWRDGEDRPFRSLGDFRWGASVAAFSPDGRLVAAGGGNRLVRVFDVETGAEVLRLGGHSYWLTAIEFDGSGRLLASGSADRTIRVWDVATREALHVLRGHDGDVASLSFGPRSQRLVSAGPDRTVRLWDLVRGEPLRTIAAHEGPVLGAYVAAGGRSLVSATATGTLRAFALDPGQGTRTSVPRVGAIAALALSPDARTAAVANYYGPIDLVDLATGGVVRTLSRSEQAAKLAWSPDGRSIATGGAGGAVDVYDVASETRTALEGHAERVTGIAHAGDGRVLVTTSLDGTIRLRPPSGGARATVVDLGEPIHSVAVDPGGRFVVAGGERVRVVDALSGAVQAEVPAGDGPALALALSPDGGLLATGGRDTVVRLIALPLGELLAELRGHGQEVRALAFSPDGRLLASSGPDRVVLLWDVAARQRAWTLSGATQTVDALVFDPTGRFLLASGADQTLRVWGFDRPGDPEGAERRAGRRADGSRLVPGPTGECEPALPAWPVRVEDPLRRGAMYLGEQNHVPAAEWFEWARRIDPDSLEARIGYGLAMAGLDRAEEAIASLEPILPRIPPGAFRDRVESELRRLRGR